MKYAKKDGTNNHVLILLHGTGGSRVSLFGLADLIDPEATYLGIEGDVNEHGQLRFFERNLDGSFRLYSLTKSTHELQKLIGDLLELHQLTGHKVILVGFSNGANLAVNLLKEYSTTYDLAIILHPSASPTDAPFKSQEKLRVLLTFGEDDPYIRRPEFDAMVADFQAAQIPVRSYTHIDGHTIKQGEVMAAIEEIEGLG